MVKATVFLTDLVAFRPGQQDHGRILSRAVPGARRGRRRRRCRAARRSKWSASSPCDRLEAGHGAARRRRGAGGAAARLGRGNHPGSAVPAAPALRGSHPRGAVGRAPARTAGGGRGRGAAHRDRVSRPAPDAVQDRRRLGIPDAAILSISPRSSSNGLARGVRVRCFGEARRGPNGLEMVHPEYRRVDPQSANADEEHLTPIYPAHRGHDPGTTAPVGRVGAGSDHRERSDGLAAAVGTRRFAPARACARRCSTCTGRRRMRRWICC